MARKTASNTLTAGGSGSFHPITRGGFARVPCTAPTSWQDRFEPRDRSRAVPEALRTPSLSPPRKRVNFRNRTGPPIDALAVTLKDESSRSGREVRQGAHALRRIPPKALGRSQAIATREQSIGANAVARPAMAQ